MISMVLPINIGYYQYKSVKGNKFLTRIEKCTVKNMTVSNVDKITILSGSKRNVVGETYFVGIGKPNLDLDKSEKEFTKICVLNMIGKVMGSAAKMDLTLLLTAPPMTYSNQVEALPEYLIGEYDIIHNGIQKHICINDVKVIPESFLIMLNNNPEQYEGKELFIFDFGGMTSTIARIVNLSFAVTREHYVSIPRGMYHIDCSIADLLKVNQKLRCDYSNIDIYRETQKELLQEESEGIEDIYCKHIDDLLEQATIKGWEISKGSILVSGGGAKHLYNCLKDNYFHNAVMSKDCLFDNLKGLEIIMREAYGNDNSFVCG